MKVVVNSLRPIKRKVNKKPKQPRKKKQKEKALIPGAWPKWELNLPTKSKKEATKRTLPRTRPVRSKSKKRILAPRNGKILTTWVYQLLTKQRILRLTRKLR